MEQESEHERRERARRLEFEIQFREHTERALQRARSDAHGKLRPDLWNKGIDHLGTMKVGAHPRCFAGFGGAGPGSAALGGAAWSQIGPAPLVAGSIRVAGRVYDIAIDPGGASDQTIYLATVGGIWKSTDGG